MNKTVIKVENVSKQYRLGMIGTNTLKGDLQRWWHNMRGLADPTLMIGQENNLNKVKAEVNVKRFSDSKSYSDDFIWALRDINFEVKQGEVLGIIGKNGAGKSTLLKLLSRVTAPTTGNIKVKGRIASLLEVGTGFHPDLTGRENIFLNGAILGMTKTEIRSKFDEIVDFAGVAKYIETPVKRYSSGMYVRLAFAVAAHLEPEILIVDEVLAVGDAEFQKKALGKMKNVSLTDGRTVLFVSHNMAAVTSLCNRGLYLKNGMVEQYSQSITNVVYNYLNDGNISNSEVWEGNEGDNNVRIYKTQVAPADSGFGLSTSTDLILEIEGEILKPILGLILGFTLWSQFDYELAYSLYDDNQPAPAVEILPQKFSKKFKIPANTLAEGNYRIQFDIGIHFLKRIINNECDLQFTLVNINGLGKRFLLPEGKGRTSLVRANWAL